MKKLNTSLFLLCLGYLVYDFFYFEKLFKFSADIWLQLDPPSIPFLQKICFYISTFGYEALVIIMVCLCAADSRRIRSMKILGLNCLYGAIFIGTKKMFLAYQRPWWENTAIKTLGCDRDYGRPSGHSEWAVFSYLLIYRELFVRPHKQHRPKPEGTSRSTARRIFRDLLITISLAVMAARWLLGVHSFDQVIGGAAWAYISFSIYKVLLEDKVDKIFMDIADGSWRKNLKFYIFLTVALNIITSIIPIVAYHIAGKSLVGHEAFWKLVFRSRCKDDKHYEGPLELCLYRSTPISLMFGMIYGLMLLPEKFRHQYLDMHLTTWMKIARMVIMGVLVGIPASYLAKILTFESELIYYRYWFREVLRLVICGIFLSALCPVCFYYLKLVGTKIEKKLHEEASHTKTD